MIVWRICREKFVAKALEGIGAKMFGGRWNRVGEPMVSSSSSASLAAFETLVHTDPSLAPSDLHLVEISIPDGTSIEELSPSDLPPDWRDLPAPESLKELGSAWVRAARSLVLVVPSAVIPEEDKWLINPSHPEATQVRIVRAKPFTFDPRVWKTLAPPGE